MLNVAFIFSDHTLIRPNFRWCADHLKFFCWNGDVVCIAFIIDESGGRIISWSAIANAEISDSDTQEMMLEAIEKRFGATSELQPIEHFFESGGGDEFMTTGLVPRFMPVASPLSKGVVEAFVSTLTRDYISTTPIPDGETALSKIAGWIDEYHEIHRPRDERFKAFPQ